VGILADLFSDGAIPVDFFAEPFAQYFSWALDFLW